MYKNTQGKLKDLLVSNYFSNFDRDWRNEGGRITETYLCFKIYLKDFLNWILLSTVPTVESMTIVFIF